MAIYIAPGARVTGNVTLGENVNIWDNAVVRADDCSITIGDCSNVQDNATLHIDSDAFINIGKYVTIGHNAIVHGCTIGDNTMIGMGSIVMNHAVIGRNCIIGAGALVTEGKQIPDGSVVMGVPGKVVKEISPEQIEFNTKNACHYAELAEKYLSGELPTKVIK